MSSLQKFFQPPKDRIKHIPFGTPGPATCRRAHGLKKVASKKTSKKR